VFSANWWNCLWALNQEVLDCETYQVKHREEAQAAGAYEVLLGGCLLLVGVVVCYSCHGIKMLDVQ
jgi:hypothetical protein